MMVGSLVILNLRYAFYYRQSKEESLKPLAVFLIKVAADFIPVTCLIATIHLEGTGEWDCLLVNYLRPPRDDELSTECGS